MYNKTPGSGCNRGFVLLIYCLVLILVEEVVAITDSFAGEAEQLCYGAHRHYPAAVLYSETEYANGAGLTIYENDVVRSVASVDGYGDVVAECVAAIEVRDSVGYFNYCHITACAMEISKFVEEVTHLNIGAAVAGDEEGKAGRICLVEVECECR